MKRILKILFFINGSFLSTYSQDAFNVGFASVTTDYKSIHVIVLKTFDLKIAQYIFYRADESSNNFKEIARTTDNFYTDTNVETNKQVYCYRVAYVKLDGVKSDISEPFCSILLTSKNQSSIEWTPFLNLPNAQPVEYFIDLINNDGSINRSIPNKTSNLSIKIDDIEGVKKEIEDFDKAVIRIRAKQPTTFYLNNQILTNYPVEIYSNALTIIPPPNIYLPSAFTPDGDTKNEIFMALGKRIVEFRMTIFNKWGEIVFESFDMNTGWDGTQLDRITPSPLGYYAYKILAKDKFNQPYEKTGSVLLIR